MKINAIDLFSGIGGLTYGLENAGINVVAGIDNESSCEFAYSRNTNARFILGDIKKISSQEIEALYPKNTDIKILVGCAPCQPFSSYSYRYKKEGIHGENMDLLDYFGKYIEDILPEYISMENVPQMVKTPVFDDFLATLERLNYHVDWQIVYAPDYGVPQKRKRLILIASKNSEIYIPEPLYTEKNYISVKDTIGHLPPIKSGESDKDDPIHVSRKLSAKNMERIKQSIPGGTWEDWDEDLILDAHKKTTGNSYKSVYGRMEWDKLAPTITTQFIGFGNGRFGHPEQDRGLSLREGALLQTFPENYVFSEDDQIYTTKIAKQIGNAVPVRLGEVIGETILNNIRDNY